MTLYYDFFFIVNEEIRFTGRLQERPCAVLLCPNHVTVGLPYCPRHRRLIQGLAIKKSSIPNSGQGLFTTKEFNKGELICKYVGEHIDEEELERRYGKYTAPYGMSLTKNKYIDGALVRGIGNLINHNFKRNANVEFRNTKDGSSRRITGIDLVATKNIPANTELFVHYGSKVKLKENGVESMTLRTPKTQFVELTFHYVK